MLSRRPMVVLILAGVTLVAAMTWHSSASPARVLTAQSGAIKGHGGTGSRTDYQCKSPTGAYVLTGGAAFPNCISPGEGGTGWAVEEAIPADPSYLTWAAIDFQPSTLGMSVTQLNTLSTDYFVKTGSCGAGDPRFELWLYNPTTNDASHIFSYIGTPPFGSGCTSGSWQSTGNVAAPTAYVDDSQLPGGSVSDTWAHLQAAYPGYLVEHIEIGADSTANPLTVDYDNTKINSTLYTYN